MSHSDELERCKMEIRSVLITFQGGCSFFVFNHAYKDIIGITLPFRKFGFHKGIEFLYSMPDVVKITTNELGRHNLQAVAEDKTKHIQQMVAKQKPAASRHSSKASTSYIVPSQFTESILQFCETIEKQLKDLPEQVLQSKDEHKLLPKASLKENIIALVQYFDNKIAFDDLLCEYLKMYKKSVSFSKYGYASLNECIEDTPELSIETINRCSFIVYHSNSSDSSDTDESDSIKEVSKPSSIIKNHQSYGECSVKKSPEIPPIPNSEYNATKKHSEATIADYLRKKLVMVAERFKEGILSSDFPSYFEEATGDELDFHILGYKYLIQLIDDVPDLFKRVPLAGSKFECTIYSVYKPEPDDSFFYDSSISQKVFIEQVIVNLRKILEFYPEGVQLQELLHIYSIYSSDILDVKDYGFDDLQTFLSNVETRVPLRIDSSDGVNTIYLHHDSSSESFQKEVIPFDVVYSDFKFKYQDLPTNIDYSKYFPMYVSQVQHAGHLYIQLEGKETSDVLCGLYRDIQNFYCRSKSKSYIMKSAHIKVGVPCIAKWNDEHLYRGEIISISSAETVVVNFVDYGSRDTIRKEYLQYMKKEFSHLPAQALNCRLAFLKPPKDATRWDIETRSRILSMCKDVPLMAKLEDIGSDGVYSVLLCDTNGEDDVFINYVLCNEGLADYVPGNFTGRIRDTCEPVVPVNYLQTLNTLQAQNVLHEFGTIFQSYAQNENYLNLARQVNTSSSNPNPQRQDVGIPHITTFGTSGFDDLSNMYEDVNSNIVPKAHHISSTSENQDINNNCTIQNSIHGDNEDEINSQFCQKFSFSQIRHVKRVMLGEGYKIHVVAVDSKPYASSDDIVNLFFSNKSEDFLYKKVQLKNIDIPVLNLPEWGNEELFQQLKQFGVKDVQKVTGSSAFISLYPLIEVINILNIFGHPSITVRRKLNEEIANFNPNDPEWMNFSAPEPLEPEEEENFSQDDVMNRLCMIDLLTMEESIKLRRNMMTNSVSNSVSNVNSNEVNKLLELHQKVLQRIQEIKGISNMIV